MKANNKLPGFMGPASRWPRSPWIALIMLLIGLGWMGLPSVRNWLAFARVRAEFPEAKARWEAQAITNYDVEVSQGLPSCLGQMAVLEVRGGRIVAVTQTTYPYPGSKGETKVIIPGSDEGKRLLGLCGYKTIPEILEMTEHTINVSDPHETCLRVSFDSEYGFVTSYTSGCNNRGMGVSAVHYSYHDFEPR